LVEFWESLRSIQSYHIFPNVLRSPQPTEARYPLAENGGNLASVLQGMRSDYPDAFQDILSTLGQMVPAIVDVDVIHAGGHLHLEFTHKMANAAKPTVLNSAQESDGTLRLLGILTALYQDSPPGFTAPSVIVVEEPELAVHPGALAVLAEVMTETARRTSLLVTTHSPQLLDRLPVECIRVVESRDSVTYAGPVASYQQEAVKEHLFTPGEIHTIDGLQFDRQVG
jgi:predicted ATPase